MNRRLLIIIPFIALLLAALATAVWTMWSSRTPEPAVPPAVSESTPETSAPDPIQQVPAEQAVTDANSLNLQQTAFIFAEGYGSYSTDAPFDNLHALDRLITNSLRQQFEQTMSVAQSVPDAFYSSTSRALTIDILRQDASSAEAVVQVQRNERFSRDGEPKLSYQNLRLTLARDGERWLVDEVGWGK
jgi:hypothetical protein